MRFPIDASNLTFIAGSDPAGVNDREGRQRSDEATGELLWGLNLVGPGRQGRCRGLAYPDRLRRKKTETLSRDDPGSTRWRAPEADGDLAVRAIQPQQIRPQDLELTAGSGMR
jgi:hypothetical protein